MSAENSIVSTPASTPNQFVEWEAKEAAKAAATERGEVIEEEIETPEGDEGDESDESPDEDEDDGEESESETAPPAEADDKQEKKGKGKTGLEKRFSALTGQIRALEAQLLAKGESGNASPAPTKTEAAADDPEPELEKYEDYNSFTKDLTKWAVRQEAKQAAVFASEKEVMNGFLDRQKITAAKHKDYGDVVTKNNTPISEAIRHAVVTDPFGPELAYHLGKHPEVTARIMALPKKTQEIELGKIIAKITPAEPVKEKQVVSKAPKPASRVGSGGSPEDKMPDPSNFGAWEKWQARQEAKNK